MVHVVLITGSELIEHGIRGMLARVDDVALEAVVQSLSRYLNARDELKADVLLVDTQSNHKPASARISSQELQQITRDVGVVVLADWTSRERLRMAQLLNLKGLCLTTIVAAELVDAIHTVAGGNTYIHHAYAAQAEIPDPTLGEYHSLLGARQTEILYLMLHGYANKDIAELLHISLATVKTHVRAILKKLDARDRTQAISRELQKFVDRVSHGNDDFLRDLAAAYADRSTIERQAE